MEQKSRELTSPSSPGTGLRVLIDARKILDGGIGVFTKNLIAGLLESGHPGVRLGVLGNKSTLGRFPWGNEVEIIEDRARPYSLDEMMLLPRRLRPLFARGEYDLFHAPHYTLPVGLSVPSIVTIHDLIHIRNPQRRYYPTIASMLIRSAVRRASRVVTVSEATRKDVLDLLNDEPRLADKISVIPNALDPSFLTYTFDPDFLAQRFGLSENYLLCIASMLKPHKGIEDLLRAFSDLRLAAAGAAPGGVRLVIAGQAARHMTELRRCVRAAGGCESSVVLLGEVSQEELFHLYSGALALAVPSLAEGFCLPVLEAQSVGTPVIARPVPAVQELLTERDRYCGDFSIDGLRSALLGFLKAVREGRIERPGNRTIPFDHLQKFERAELGRAWIQAYLDVLGRLPTEGVREDHHAGVDLEEESVRSAFHG